MDEVNARIADGYVPYGSMVRAENEYVQVLVALTDKIQGRSASLLWQYFSDSGAMLNVAVDPVQNLMDTAAVNILEEFTP